jgi:hypothetical protein
LLAALALTACGPSLPSPHLSEAHGGPDEHPVEVQAMPPPGKVEIIPARPPALKHPVWLDGEWEWTGRRWQWKDGGWLEDRPDEVYFPGKTVRRSDGVLVHYPGLWKKPEPAKDQPR